MRAFHLLGLAFLGCNAPVALNPVDGSPPSGGGDPEGVEDIPGSDTGAPDTGGPDPVSDALFDVSTIHEIRIELAADSRASLTALPREYAHATIEIGGEVYEDVGVRLKGNNSFRPLTEKPSFKIKLDEFVDQSHGRVEGLTLNNMIEDPTYAREILTYWLWNDAGMIAPRASYAHVTVDGEDYGLYLLLETMDKAFLKRRFEDPTGDLWEGEDEADFTPGGLAYYDLKAGDGDATRLEAAATALASPTADYYAMADEHFQMDQVIDYYAWMTVSANLDGYPFTLNDYFIYSDPAAGGRFAMSPWGMDESWNPAFEFQWGVGVALFSCAADNACLDRVKARTEVALQHYESTDVPARLESFYALSATRATNDPRSTWTLAEIEAERAALLDFTRSWPARLRAQMAE